MTSTTKAVFITVAGAVLVVGLVWYFAVYDTAEGRCNRGDLGACFVVYAKQSAAASVAAAAASASAAAAAASVEASIFAENGCTVGPGDHSHDVRLTVSNPTSAVQRDACQGLLHLGWEVAGDVPGATQVCEHVDQGGTTYTVNDTGGQYYGQRVCDQLNRGEVPSWGGG